MLAIIRPPFTYKFSDLESFEEPIITFLLGYLQSIEFHDYTVYDFHLDRDLNLNDIKIENYKYIIVVVRETVECVHYANRICSKLRERCSTPLFLYGQTGRLANLKWPSETIIVKHDETCLAKCIDLPFDGNKYQSGLRAKPYADLTKLSPSQRRRFKAGLETTRGCHFPCTFCFINSGPNYSRPWMMRSNDDILQDVAQYYDFGVKNVLFYDSEFLGANERLYSQRLELLTSLSQRFSDLRYKIYCRADTLEKFNRYDELKDSGLVQVFIGVESFYQPDLDRLNKKLRVDTILSAIDALVSRNIFVTLSFITFNRNSDIESISYNIKALKDLYLKYTDKARFLGMPNFVFGLESSWTMEEGRSDLQLSDLTYVKADLKQKSQPIGASPVFDPALEPLIEIYRLLAYEWSKKVVELSKYRETASIEEISKIESWFDSLSMFCILLMERYLNKYKNKSLNMASISENRDELFKLVAQFYQGLPSNCQSLATYEDHASLISYQADVSMLEDHEYWSQQI